MKILFCLLPGLLWACSQSKPASGDAGKPVPADTVAAAPGAAASAAANVEVQTFASPGGGYGYDVYVDGNKMIHQPHRPGVAGQQGFATEEKARKAGGFVADKVRRNIMPPSVTQAELDSLGVL